MIAIKPSRARPDRSVEERLLLLLLGLPFGLFSVWPCVRGVSYPAVLIMTDNYYMRKCEMDTVA